MAYITQLSIAKPALIGCQGSTHTHKAKAVVVH